MRRRGGGRPPRTARRGHAVGGSAYKCGAAPPFLPPTVRGTTPVAHTADASSAARHGRDVAHVSPSPTP